MKYGDADGCGRAAVGGEAESSPNPPRCLPSPRSQASWPASPCPASYRHESRTLAPRSARHSLTAVIPDHTAMKFFVRAQSAKGVDTLVDRVKACFEGAATATGCKVKYNVERMMYDLRNNLPIAEEYAAAMGEEYNLPVKVAIDDWSMSGGSTDFGNVSGSERRRRERAVRQERGRWGRGQEGWKGISRDGIGFR